MEFTRLNDAKRTLLLETLQEVKACNNAQEKVQHMDYLEEILEDSINGFIPKIAPIWLRLLFKDTGYEKWVTDRKLTSIPYFEGITKEALALMKPIFITVGYNEEFIRKYTSSYEFRNMFKDYLIIAKNIPDTKLQDPVLRWSLTGGQTRLLGIIQLEAGFTDKVKPSTWQETFNAHGELDLLAKARLQNRMETFQLALPELARESFKEVMRKTYAAIIMKQPTMTIEIDGLLAKGAPKEDYPEAIGVDHLFQALARIVFEEEDTDIILTFVTQWGDIRSDNINEIIDTPQVAAVLSYIRELGFRGTGDRFYDITPEDFKATEKFRAFLSMPYQDIDLDGDDLDWKYNETLGTMVLFDY